MTRVVVQRGLGASNPSQSRSSTSSSSSNSGAPTPPPLPPPFVPLSSLVTAQTFSPSSSPSSSSKIGEEGGSEGPSGAESHPFGGVNSDACFEILECHYSDSKARDSGSTRKGKSQDEGSTNRHTMKDIEGREVQSMPYLDISSIMIDDAPTGVAGLHSQREVGYSDHGRSIDVGSESRTMRFEYEQVRMQQEDVKSLKTHSEAVNNEGIEAEEITLSLGGNRTQSFPAQPGQFCTHPVPSSSLDPLQSQSEELCPATMQSSSSTCLSHLPSCGSGSAIQPLEGVDQFRPTLPSKTVETVACSILATTCPLPVPPSSRRSSWIGPSTASGLSIEWTYQKLPRNVKASRSIPPLSCSTSPTSCGEGDGYNSADEQNPWGSRSSLFEHSDERELQFEIEIRRAKGLDVRWMCEDGNCLFRAIADQVYGDAEMHKESRQMCIDYMEKETEHFSQFVTESFTAYCKRKQRDKVYGNNLEIQAMAEMYNRPIHIYSYSIDPINIFQGSYQTDLPPIRLSYHRGNHYNSLVDPCNPSVGAGLGFGSFHGAHVDSDKVKAAIKAQQDQQLEKALLAEGRYFSDLELTEQEMERMAMDASRADFLAKEQMQHFDWLASSASARAEPSSSCTVGSSKNFDLLDLSQADKQRAYPVNYSSFSEVDADSELTSNMRMLLSMGFSYLRVLEAYSIFGDDVNDMLCYLLEVETGSPQGDCVYRMKGKAAEM
eukprot:c29003_g1_i5 orf=563-2716(+)